MPPRPEDVTVLHAKLQAGVKLTPKQWSRLERFLEDWRHETLAAAAKHPAKSYELGVAQVKAFAGLLTNLGTAAGHLGAFGGDSATLRAGQAWAKRYLLHELDGALSRFIDRIKSELLYGIRAGENPTLIAGRLYKATQDASVNWRMIARTEMVRANAAGRLKACADAGYDRVWCPPHIGSCRSCKRILEGKIFPLASVIEATNYGKHEGAWVACIPLHPNCRHSWLPYDPDVYAAAMGGYAEMEAAGLTDEAFLDDVFDESGQLKPGVDPAIFDAAKTDSRFTNHESGPVYYRGVDAGGTGPRMGTGIPEWDRNLFATDTPERARLYGAEIQPVHLKADTRILREGSAAARPVWQAARGDAQLTGKPVHVHVLHHARKAGYHAVHFTDQAGIGTVVMDRDQVANGANVLKTPAVMDPYAEVLAAVIYKMRAPAPPRPSESLLPVGELRSDLYQRAVDPEKVERLFHLFRTGELDPEDLEPIEVSLRASTQDTDGTFWVLDGQHRVEAYKLLRWPEIRATVREGMTWGDEAQRCRDLINKVWSPVMSMEGHNEDHGPSVLKAEGDLVNSSALEMLLSPTAAPPGPCWTCGNPGHWSESDACPGAPLDPLIYDGLRPRPEIIDRLTGAWARAVGDDWRDWSWLYLPAGDGPARAQVDYPKLRRARSDWRKLADTDLHFALAAAALNATDGAELAPGRPLRISIDPDQHDITPDAGSVWALGTQEWLGPVPVGEPADMAKTHPNYRWATDRPSNQDAESVGFPRLLSEEEFLAKAAAPVANVGVEHWITVHPNGPEEKGQPVLVRNGADGTMTVIGGAGGNLNMLRLDPSRRIDDASRAKGARVEQHISSQESEASAAQREQEVAHAREQLAQLSQARGDRQAELHGYLRDQLGINVDELDAKQRRKMISKARSSALRTLAYGEVSRRDANDSPPAADFDRPANPEGTGQPLDDTDKPSSATAEPLQSRALRPSMAMTADQAKTVLDALLDISHLTKQGSTHRKVLAGESSASDANQIDFTAGADDRDQRRSKAVEQQIRTDLSRTLLGHADQKYSGKKGGYDQRYKQAATQGAFDSLDAFSHSVTGQSMLSLEAQKLLGVSGAAQLVAHHIHQQTRGGDLDQVQAALKDLTDEQERAVNERGLARMQTALRRAAQAQSELSASERGESLYTTTMARSIASEKVQEAKRGLGMMIGGLEATSALKVALDRPAGGKIKVGGWESPAKIKEAAAKAKVKVHDSDIAKIGTGNYTLSLAPERLQGLLRPEPPVDQQLRDKLEQIRTGKDLDAEIEAERTGPGMAHELDPNQAKGKMFLLAAGSGVLAFDPGVGKTHTALGAAETLMAKEPDKGHRVLITAPTNMLRSWQDTIAAQGNGRTVEVIDAGSAKKKQQQFAGDADYTIVSYESLKSPSLRKLIKDNPRSINIADELQKAKNEQTDNAKAVEEAIDSSRAAHGDDTHFYGLSGTPVEKSVNDLRTMKALARRAKGQETEDRKTAERKHGKLGQDEHIARGDKIRQFREGLDEDLFRLTAQQAGNDLPEPARTAHQVELDPEHKAEIQDRVNAINGQMGRYHATPKDERGKVPVKFGGRDQLMDALYGREDSAIARNVADEIEKTGTFTHPGGKYNDGQDHAGTYEHKHVVFGASETSRALFGRNWNAPGAQRSKGGLHAELERRGLKVFTGHGSMTSADNEASYKAFLAHPGKAVFLTNDKNNAGISLQFGDNKGNFQHGATHMHHFTRPVNNAVIQQREARILRKGSQAPVAYHTYSADTPIEQRLQETLDREKRTQDLAANSEQQVAGADTLAHHLARRGVKPQRATADAA